MPIISVIVPVYNVEKYLCCCVDSILAQTVTDIEVLLVDDGSTDSSGAICDEYAQKDSRVRVFHKANGGVSSARNLGLDEAKGKWIMFVDSDDKVAEEICERLLAYAADDCMSICIYYEWKNEVLENVCKEIEKDFFEVKEFEKIKCWLYSPWAKLYERQIICKNGLYFMESLSFGEDAVFNFEYLEFVGHIHIVDEPLYFYRILSNSLSRSKYIESLDEAREKISQLKLKLAKRLFVDSDDFIDRHYKEYFFATYEAFENNMRDEAPGSLLQKIRRNNVILKSNEFKKAFPYRNEWPQYFNKRYIRILELSYYTGNYFWLWLLGVPGKIKITIKNGIGYFVSRSE